MMRIAAKVDSNQKELVQALRQIGASVAITSMVGNGFSDTVVGFRGSNFLIEFKVGNGKLTPDQVEFHGAWQGQIAIARTIEEALAAIGAI